MYNQLKFPISLLLVFVLNTSQCQYNSIFGDSYTEWNYVQLFCDATFTITYQQSTDTLIGTNQYKVVDNLGLLREAEDNAKVWFKALGSEEEHLIMDLSLEIGDLYEINSTYYEVDDVFIENGNKIIQFDYIPINCGFEQQFRFIEGYGPNLSYQYLMTNNEDYLGHLRCHTLDDITTNLLVNDLGAECITNETSTDELVANKISVYPNPFGEQVRIQFEESSERSIKIVDYLGRIVFSEISNGLSIDINTSLYREGIYMLQIQEGTRLRSIMVVKE